MKNIGDMMRKAQEVQTRLAEMQNNLSGITITGVAGGGMVEITLNGKGETQKVKIDPKAVDVNDMTLLEDLILAACNDGHKKVSQHVEAETQKAMGGMGLPGGLKLPF